RVGVEHARAGALVTEAVALVDDLADTEGQAAAADASGQAVAQADQLLDAVVEVRAPGGRDRLPVALGGGAPLGQAIEFGLDLAQRDAHSLRDADEGDPAQHVARVAPLVSAGATTGDQALALVEVQGRHRDAAALRQLTGGQFLGTPIGCRHHAPSLGVNNTSGSPALG